MAKKTPEPAVVAPAPTTLPPESAVSEIEEYADLFGELSVEQISEISGIEIEKVKAFAAQHGAAMAEITEAIDAAADAVGAEHQMAKPEPAPAPAPAPPPPVVNVSAPDLRIRVKQAFVAAGRLASGAMGAHGINASLYRGDMARRVIALAESSGNLALIEEL